MTNLYLNDNGMTTVAANAFRNLTVSSVYLFNNRLTSYPVALSEVKPAVMLVVIIHMSFFFNLLITDRLI